MTAISGYPVSIIKEGPTFRDELVRQPQNILQEESIESLRIVPGKSAASGVYTIYFDSDNREWALVRLALRYRWLFEIQLNRGMSGERQLLQQGFTPDDLGFLFDIIPAPPDESNPIVYDMLWLVATYDEYRALTAAMLEREQFTPQQLFDDLDTVNESKIGFLTRFLRSHLIEPESIESKQMHSHNTESDSDRHAVIDETYTVTTDGEAALQGILTEYDRIFADADFEPLFINPELDPRRHFAEHSSEAAQPKIDVSFDDVRNEDGMLGEIASSFSSLVNEEEFDESNDDNDTTVEGNGRSADDTYDEPGTSETAHTPTKPGNGGLEKQKASNEKELGSGETDAAEVSPTSSNQESSNEGVKESTSSQEFGAYTETEVVDAAAAAAGCIHERRVARSHHVKEAVWAEVSVGDRDQTELWEYVTQVLMTMDRVHGRPNGRIWTAI